MRLTPEEHKDWIAERLSGGASYRGIADELGCSKDTVAAFVKRHLSDSKRTANWYAKAAAIDPSSEPDELELVRTRLKAYEKAATKGRSIDVQAEMILEEIRETVVPFEPRFEAPDQAEGSGKPHMHVLLLSDLHVGEVVNLEAMNGINEYNWAICQDRVQQVLKSVRSFQNNRPYPIENLVIGMLGDMNGGTNHEELAQTNEFPAMMQCKLTGQLLAQFIEQLVEDYTEIHVVGVSGNHPRTSKTPANKRVFDNYDWMSYEHAKALLNQYSTITWNVPLSGYTHEEIAGRNMLFMHGDGIKSTMPGVPWGGVTRRVNELRRQYAEQGTAISYVSLGHFHQACVVPGVFMNGSIKGPDEYTLKNFGGGQEPTQLLLTFNKDRERLTDVSYITPS